MALFAPGYSRDDKLLPSSTSKKQIWKVHKAAKSEQSRVHIVLRYFLSAMEDFA